MRNAQGYAVKFWDDGRVEECDTFTCNHCQKVTFVPPGASPYTLGGGCRICSGLICSQCVDLGTCAPWEQQMLEAERKHEANQMVSKLVGR